MDGWREGGRGEREVRWPRLQQGATRSARKCTRSLKDVAREALDSTCKACMCTLFVTRVPAL
jgi:hypothetical protein